MDIQIYNLCTRCGKQRIVVKTWEENSGNSVLFCTTTACPDPKCQEIVDRKLAAQKQKKEDTVRDREKRRELAKGIKTPTPQA